MFKHIRSNLIMGLIVLLPTILTIYVVRFIFRVIDPILGKFLSNILVSLYIIPQFPIHFPWLGITLQDRIPGIGLLITIFILIGVGLATKSFFGKKAITMTESLFSKIPIARSIYSTVKQITNAFTKDKSTFQRVIMVQYPRKGLYTIGFLTGETSGSEIQKYFNEPLVNVFLPTTPNPTSGWLVVVPKSEVIFLDMSVEEGLKYIISGGVVIPEENIKEKEPIL